MKFWRGLAAASLIYVIVMEARADKAAAPAVLPCPPQRLAAPLTKR
jgi:hypothetical protein